MTKYTKIKRKNLSGSEAEIESEITVSYINECRGKTLKKLLAKAELPGFRKGHVPEKVFIEKIGEVSLLEEAAEEVLREIVPEIIFEEKLDVLGRPQVILTRVAPGNPVGFKLKVYLIPEIKLPAYKEIAKKENGKKKEKIEITEKELEDAVKEIQKTYAKKDDGKKEELPTFDDNFVKSLGNFKNVEDFKEKLKESILREKTDKAKDKKRLEIAEAIIKDSQIDLPRILIESELNKMEEQWRSDVERMGLKPEDYLKHIKKDMGGLRKDWEKDAEKRARLELILNKISIDEKIKAKEEDIEREVKHLLEHYKEADPARAKIYIESMLTKEKVFEFLENLS